MHQYAFAIVAFFAIFFIGCGASKVEIEQATNHCDIMVEVRTLGSDSVSWFAGNTMYLNVNLLKRNNLFPMFVSTRSAANIDVQRGIDLVQNSDQLLEVFRRSQTELVNFGILFSDKIYEEVQLDEDDTIEKLKSVFKKVDGGSLVVFYEKDGHINDMRKVY